MIATGKFDMAHRIDKLINQYESHRFGNSALVFADCFNWLADLPENSLHGVVTDPPYGVKEYEDRELAKKQMGVGGIWRIPPTFDGSNRSALPRFTALSEKERQTLRKFFAEWSHLLLGALRPGAHVFVASNTFLSQMVFEAIVQGGLEFRGEVIRLVRTLRGGDRPKNCEDEFPDVCSLPRGCYEPWGVFRKPLPKRMTVGDCLREFQTGGLRRAPDGSPFNDVILSERTPKRERQIADHPSLKPQSILRAITYAALPLGEGILADPFAGSGSTVAAAEACGLSCIGVERYREYFDLAVESIPNLISLEPKSVGTDQSTLFFD